MNRENVPDFGKTRDEWQVRCEKNGLSFKISSPEDQPKARTKMKPSMPLAHERNNLMDAKTKNSDNDPSCWNIEYSGFLSPDTRVEWENRCSKNGVFSYRDALARSLKSVSPDKSHVSSTSENISSIDSATETRANWEERCSKNGVSNQTSYSSNETTNHKIEQKIGEIGVDRLIVDSITSNEATISSCSTTKVESITESVTEYRARERNRNINSVEHEKQEKIDDNVGESRLSDKTLDKEYILSRKEELRRQLIDEETRAKKERMHLKKQIDCSEDKVISVERDLTNVVLPDKVSIAPNSFLTDKKDEIGSKESNKGVNIKALGSSQNQGLDSNPPSDHTKERQRPQLNASSVISYRDILVRSRSSKAVLSNTDSISSRAETIVETTTESLSETRSEWERRCEKNEFSNQVICPGEVSEPVPTTTLKEGEIKGKKSHEGNIETALGTTQNTSNAVSPTDESVSICSKPCKESTIDSLNGARAEWQRRCEKNGGSNHNICANGDISKRGIQSKESNKGVNIKALGSSQNQGLDSNPPSDHTKENQRPQLNASSVISYRDILVRSRSSKAVVSNTDSISSRAETEVESEIDPANQTEKPDIKKVEQELDLQRAGETVDEKSMLAIGVGESDALVEKDEKFNVQLTPGNSCTVDSDSIETLRHDPSTILNSGEVDTSGIEDKISCEYKKSPNEKLVLSNSNEDDQRSLPDPNLVSSNDTHSENMIQQPETVTEKHSSCEGDENNVCSSEQSKIKEIPKQPELSQATSVCDSSQKAGSTETTKITGNCEKLMNEPEKVTHLDCEDNEEADDCEEIRNEAKGLNEKHLADKDNKNTICSSEQSKADIICGQPESTLPKLADESDYFEPKQEQTSVENYEEKENSSSEQSNLLPAKPTNLNLANETPSANELEQHRVSRVISEEIESLSDDCKEIKLLSEDENPSADLKPTSSNLPDEENEKSPENMRDLTDSSKNETDSTNLSSVIDLSSQQEKNVKKSEEIDDNVLLDKQNIPPPDKDEVRECGSVFSRVSWTNILFKKKWALSYWVRYGKGSLLIFHSKEEFDSWLANSSLSKKQQNSLLKHHLLFSYIAKKTVSLKGYRRTDIKLKDNMYTFKLKKGINGGLRRIAAFASRSEDDIIALKDSIDSCLL